MRGGRVSHFVVEELNCDLGEGKGQFIKEEPTGVLLLWASGQGKGAKSGGESPQTPCSGAVSLHKLLSPVEF